MKTISKLSLIAAAIAAIGSSAALADDPQLQNRLALQRQEAERSQKSTTIAVYAHQRSVGRAVQRSETRFEVRTTAHGQTFGTDVLAK